MVDEIYKNTFGSAQIQQDEDDFERGFGDDDITVIKTPGAKLGKQFKNFGATKISGVPIATFSFMTSTYTEQKKKASARKAPNKARTNNLNFDPDYTEDEGTEEKFARCFNNAQKNMRNLRSRQKPSANEDGEIKSKEVIHDGGGAGAIAFVSLNEASRQQSTRNISQMLQDQEDICDTSCEELEEYVEKQREKEKKRRKLERRKFFGLDDVATESLDENSSSGGSGGTEHRKKRRRTQSSNNGGSADNDDDDDDMYYSNDEKISNSRSKQKKYPNPDDTSSAPSLTSRSSEGSGGRKNEDEDGNDDGDGGKKHFGSTPGRHHSSAINCFLCRHGDREYDAVSKEDMNKLIKAYESGIGRQHPAALAKSLHKQYMATIFIDSKSGGGKIPLWRTRSVLEHIYYHDLEPRVQAWLCILGIRRTIDCMENTLFVREPNTGQLLPGQSTELKRKQEAHMWNIYKQPMEKMLFYSQTSQIDLPKNNKRVDGVYQKAGPRHFAHTRVSGLDAN